MAEGERAQGGGGRQRHRLGEVCADELVGAERGVKKQQQDDHQRACPDGGHPDDDPPDHPYEHRAQRPRTHLVHDPHAASRDAAVEDVAQDHCRRPQQQGCAERRLDVVLSRLGIAHQVQEVCPKERHGHGTEDHPAHEALVDGPLTQVHGRAEGTHHDHADAVRKHVAYRRGEPT